MAESDIRNNGHFSIKVRVGSTEIEVSAPEKDFVVNESKRLIEQFRFDVAVEHINTIKANQEEMAVIPALSQARTVKPQSLGEFFRQFANLQTHLEKILVFGYWCEIKQSQPHFTSEDILTKYKEARESPPANIRRDIGTLVSRGLLLPPGKSDDGSPTYALSNSGIKEVESKMSQA